MKDFKYILLLLAAIAVWGLAIFGAIVFVSPKTETVVFVYPQASEEEKYFDKLTEAIIKCESQGEMVWGDLDKPHKAYGVAQFQKRTFDWLCELSGKDLDYYSAEDQKELLRWALENWHGRLWTCYSVVKGF